MGEIVIDVSQVLNQLAKTTKLLEKIESNIRINYAKQSQFAKMPK